jgi:hypothetical protein
MAGSAKIFFKDFACSSKIKPAVVGLSKESTTSLIAKNRKVNHKKHDLPYQIINE